MALTPRRDLGSDLRRLARADEQVAAERDRARDEFAALSIRRRAGLRESAGSVRARRMLRCATTSPNICARGNGSRSRSPSSLTVTEEECRQFYERSRAAVHAAAAVSREPSVSRGAGRNTAGGRRGEAEARSKRSPRVCRRARRSRSLPPKLRKMKQRKTNGGDLGFFSAARMPAGVCRGSGEAARRASRARRSRRISGFTSSQLTDAKPPRELAFEEARPEIAQRLRNEKRAAAVGDSGAASGVTAEFVRTPTRS